MPSYPRIKFVSSRAVNEALRANCVAVGFCAVTTYLYKVMSRAREREKSDRGQTGKSILMPRSPPFHGTAIFMLASYGN